MRAAAPGGLLAAALAIALAAGTAGCLHDPLRQAEMERREAFDMLTRAQRMKQQGDYLLARDLLLRAAELSERPIIYYEIANTHYLLGNPEQARPYYERALELAPDYALAQAELDLVTLELRRMELEEETATVQTPEPPASVAEPAPPPAEEPAEAAPRPATPDETVEVAEVEPETPADPPEPEEVAVADEEEPPVEPEVPEDELPAPQDELAEIPVEELEPDDPDAAPVAPPRPTGGPFAGIGRAFGAVGDPVAAPRAVDLDEIDMEETRAAIFPELVEEADLPSEELAARARASQEAGRYDEAVRAWGRYLAREPDDLEARLALGESLHRSGRTRRAAEEYRAAVRRAPDNPMVHFEQGNFFVQTREFGAAERAFRQALELDPDHLRARNNLGAAMLEAGRPAGAAAEFRAVLDEDPEFLPAWLNLALALDDMGRPAEEVREPLETYARLSGRLDPETDRWLRSLRR